MSETNNYLNEWLNGNKLGFDIVTKKYLQEGEDFNDFVERVTGGDPEAKRLFIDKKFIPAGRILSNRGLSVDGVKSTLSNCYVLSVDDSIESIYDCAAKMARTYSYGGGVGIDISKLRPAGAVVKNSAKTTTGAISFMKTFDVVTGTIGQHGRRGALMISIDINHPDVPEFINIKANTDQITNANISVRTHDSFMEAVENNEDYVLRWPCEVDIDDFDKKDLEYDKLTRVETENGNIYLRKVKAKELFTTIAKNNWDYGEPGVLYWDRITSYHMMSENDEFEYAGVNPCLTGDTIVKTSNGDMRLDEIVQKYENGESVQVASYNIETGTVEYKDVYNGLLTRENANIIQIETEDGNTIKLTPDHKVYTENRGWIEAANLIETDILLEIE